MLRRGGRAGQGRVVEGFVDFDYEITLLSRCSIRAASVSRAHRAIFSGMGTTAVLAAFNP